jgi:hypothetical protein
MRRLICFLPADQKPKPCRSSSRVSNALVVEKLTLAVVQFSPRDAIKSSGSSGWSNQKIALPAFSNSPAQSLNASRHATACLFSIIVSSGYRSGRLTNFAAGRVYRLAQTRLRLAVFVSSSSGSHSGMLSPIFINETGGV